MSIILTPSKRKSFIKVRNRTVMSAMTRGFADVEHKATAEIQEYYRRRAAGGVGLILTEGIIIHPSADGYNNVPHIATDEQAQSWVPVIKAVQSEGASIACQLWHCGRISHPEYTGGLAPVSSTKRAADGVNRQNNKPYGAPRALSHSEIILVYEQFADAAKRAMQVEFDAVELHLGHGYLVDQFLDARINDRSDSYGGSIENRCRFAIELVERILKIVPQNRLIARISPSRFMGGIYDWPDMEDMLNYLLPQLWRVGLRNIDISCANADYYLTSGRVIRQIRHLWHGTIIGGASLRTDEASDELESGMLDLVTWGRAFIANPDLASKIKNNIAWNVFDDEMRGHLV